MAEARTLFFIFLGVFPFCASAQELARVQADRSQALVGQKVEIVVDIIRQGTRGFYCGFTLSMGDGNTRDVRVTEKDIPFRISHTYTNAGSFPITVEGKTLIRGLKTAVACAGGTRSTAVTVMTEDAAIRAAEEAKAAAERAAAERRAAEARAAAETKAAAEARAIAEKAAAERAAAEAKAAAQRAAAARAAAETKAAAERAKADRAAVEAKAAADRAGASKAAQQTSPSPKAAETESETSDQAQRSPAAAPQKKPPVKAKSAMDL